MKSSNKFKAAALAAFTMAGGAVAQAITIDTVTVGNPGDVADINFSAGGGDGLPGDFVPPAVVRWPTATTSASMR